MQDQWSSYYQGQAPPQASTSFDYTQVPQQQQQQQQLQQPQHPRQSLQPIMTTIPEQQMQLDQSTYLMPPLYTGDSSLSLSMRSGTSSSISSSVSSASGHVSPTSMRTSMSSSTTGRTPSTPASSISLASPFFTKDGQTLPTQESWFGSLQDSYLSSHPPVYDAQQAARPTLYRMDRMSISSPIPSASEQPTWGQTSMSPQQRTPRRASVAVFQSSPSNQTPSYSAQQITYNPQANYQSPPQQQMSYVPQQLQTWQQPISSVPYQQSTYAYQQPIPITGTSSDAVQSTYSMPANTGMGINLSQSYYPSQTCKSFHSPRSYLNPY